jgi:23S rRNA (cytidine1920-2'-O)/16S rRNA (cytidine1409-2'-O)-methyltransferase
MPFVSRGGCKLDHALTVFALDVVGLVCADLGSNTGGFVDCLLQRGAARVYAIERGYGVLAWNLRRDARVVVHERTNAMHVRLPEPVAFISIDVSWTRQRHILPAVRALLAPGGNVVSLIKPHYEAPPTLLRRGVLPPQAVEQVLQSVHADIAAAGFAVAAQTPSPLTGAGGNREWLVWLRPEGP